MGMERRKGNCADTDPEVTKRLIIVLVLMIALICVFGGYMLGRMTYYEIKRNDLLTFNLTVIADTLYRKSKKISPKTIYNHDTEKVRQKLLAIFDCTPRTHCICPPTLDKSTLPDFIKNTLNIQVERLMKLVHNASMYLNTLR